MSNLVAEAGRPVNITATGTVCAGSCVLIGFYVNNTTAGTLVLRTGANGTSSGTAIGGTITPAIGFNDYHAICPGGLHATVGGAIDATFMVVEQAV